MFGGVVYCGVQKRCISWFILFDRSSVTGPKKTPTQNNMPVDPKFIGLAMKAIDKAVDSSFGEKALDRLVKEPQVEKNRKKKRSSRNRPSVPRRRSERQARNKRIAANDLRKVDEEPLQQSDFQRSPDLNGPGNMSGFTYATCGTTVKTDKYQPVVGKT